jgi:hypothetical protein
MPKITRHTKRRERMSEKRNEGGAAYPVMDTLRANDINSLVCTDGGMTMRDYFAGQALQQLIAIYDRQEFDNTKGIANAAYRYADAMLVERDMP